MLASASSPLVRATAPARPLPPTHRRRATSVSASAGGPQQQRGEGRDAAVLRMTDDLRLLEAERDEAVATAEGSARSAVKLEEMARLLEQLALSKLAEGDEAGARSVLQEKAAVSEMLSRTSSKAQANFALASKLATKIGQQQAELMELLAPGPGRTTASTSTTSSSTRQSSFEVPITREPSTSSSSSSTSSSGFYEAPWERSLRDAQQRVAAAEDAAAAAGVAAGNRARESIEEARERLRQASFSDIDAARRRIRRTASESIEEARARIAAEDAAALAEVHKVVARYRSGAYVRDEELDWAFAQLEKRSWR